MGKLCQYCNKREAKIHFTEIRDGKQTEMHICEQCAQEKNMVLAFPSLLSHIVKGAGGAPSGAESDAVPSNCPQCGLAYSDFKSKGRLGCAGCYDAFAPVLAPLLDKVHGAASHTGKAPPRMETVIASRKEVEELQEQLEQAVKAEEYERAAALRDRIRALAGEEDGEP
jgi:protein arginine kinase activator